MGRVSHTEGSGCRTIADGSHAEGLYTIANRVGQHVEGWFNTPNTSAIQIIGNGTSTANRSNAWEVYTNQIIASVPVYSTNIPTPPTADGTYTLKCTVSNADALVTPRILPSLSQ